MHTDLQERCIKCFLHVSLLSAWQHKVMRCFLHLTVVPWGSWLCLCALGCEHGNWLIRHTSLMFIARMPFVIYQDGLVFHIAPKMWFWKSPGNKSVEGFSWITQGLLLPRECLVVRCGCWRELSRPLPQPLAQLLALRGTVDESFGLETQTPEFQKWCWSQV